MGDVIICEKCGTRVRAGRDRCPRCRAFLKAPDPAQAAAESRKLLKATGVLVGGFLLLLAVLWFRRDATPVTSPSRPVAAAPSPKRDAGSDANQAQARAPQLGHDRPFLDAAGEGAVAYEAGDLATSLAKFQAAIERNPKDADSLSNLGQVLVKMNRPADAIPYLSRAVSLAPDRWAYQFNLARALGLVGRMDESIQGYRKAQELFPNDYVTTFNLALSLHKNGDEAAAVDQYQKAITLQPDDASFRKALAISYERLQKSAEAAAAYQEYLRLSPSAPDADKVRARIAELTGAPASSASSETGRL